MGGIKLSNNGRRDRLSGIEREGVFKWTEKWTVPSFRTTHSGTNFKEGFERGDYIYMYVCMYVCMYECIYT